MCSADISQNERRGIIILWGIGLPKADFLGISERICNATFCVGKAAKKNREKKISLFQATAYSTIVVKSNE